MSDPRALLERETHRFVQADGAFERLQGRRERKRRNQRMGAGILGIAVFALAAIGFVRLFGSEHTPASTGVTSASESELPRLLTPGEILDQEQALAVDAVGASGARRTLAPCSPPCTRIARYALSPDGRWLAYDVETCLVSAPCDPSAGLWVTNGVDPPRQVSSTCPDRNSVKACVGDIWVWGKGDATLVHQLWEEDGAPIEELNLATGEGRVLAEPTGPVWAMDVSPTGAFAYTTEQPNALVILNADGTVSPASPEVGTVNGLAWSPDGSKLAIDAVAGDRERVVVVNADGTDPRVLVDGPEPEGPAAPAWSPDGTRIAYVSTPGTPGAFTFEVWTIGVDGSNPTRLYHSACCIGDWRGPRWSNDGTRIAFTDDVSAPDGSWLTVNADGSGAPETVAAGEVADWIS